MSNQEDSHWTLNMPQHSSSDNWVEGLTGPVAITHLYAYGPKDKPTRYFFTAPLDYPPLPEAIRKLSTPLFLDENIARAKEAGHDFLLERTALSNCGKFFKRMKILIPPSSSLSSTNARAEEGRVFDERLQRSYQSRFDAPFSESGASGIYLLPESLRGRDPTKLSHEEHDELPVLVVPDDLEMIKFTPEQARSLENHWVVLSPPEGSGQSITPLMVVFREPPKIDSTSLPLGVTESFSSSSSSANKEFKVLIGARFSDLFGGGKDEFTKVSDETTLAANTILTAMCMLCQTAIPRTKILEWWEGDPNGHFSPKAFDSFNHPHNLASRAVSPIESSKIAGSSSTTSATSSSSSSRNVTTTVNMGLFQDTISLRDLIRVSPFIVRNSEMIMPSSQSGLRALQRELLHSNGRVTSKAIRLLRTITSAAMSVLRTQLTRALKSSLGLDFEIMRARMIEALKTSGEPRPITDLLTQLYQACNTVCTDLYIWSIELLTGGLFTFSDLVNYIAPIERRYPELTYYCDITRRRNAWLAASNETQKTKGIVESLVIKQRNNLVNLLGTGGGTDEDSRSRIDDRFYVAQTLRYMVPEPLIRRLESNINIFSRAAKASASVIKVLQNKTTASDDQLAELFEGYVQALETTDTSKQLVGTHRHQESLSSSSSSSSIEGNAERPFHSKPLLAWDETRGVRLGDTASLPILIKEYRDTMSQKWPLESYTAAPSALASLSHINSLSNNVGAADRDLLHYVLSATNPAAPMLEELRLESPVLGGPRLVNLPYERVIVPPGVRWTAGSVFVVGDNEGLASISLTPSPRDERFQVALFLATTASVTEGGKTSGRPVSPGCLKIVIATSANNISSPVREALREIIEKVPALHRQRHISVSWDWGIGGVTSQRAQLLVFAYAEAEGLVTARFQCERTIAGEFSFYVKDLPEVQRVPTNPATLGSLLTLRATRADSMTSEEGPSYILTAVFSGARILHGYLKDGPVKSGFVLNLKSLRRPNNDVSGGGPDAGGGGSFTHADMVPGSPNLLTRWSNKSGTEACIILYHLPEDDAPQVTAVIDEPHGHPRFCLMPRPRMLQDLDPAHFPDIDKLVLFSSRTGTIENSKTTGYDAYFLFGECHALPHTSSIIGYEEGSSSTSSSKTATGSMWLHDMTGEELWGVGMYCPLQDTVWCLTLKGIVIPLLLRK